MSSVKLKDRQGREFPLNFDTLRLGRAVDNDIVLNDKSISRYHLALQPIADGVLVFNTGSEGGFYINSEWFLDSGTARAGDVIRVGNEEFLVDAPRADLPQFEFALAGEKTNSLNVNSKTKRIRMVLFGILGIMAIGIVLFPDDSAPEEKAAKIENKETQPLPTEAYLDSENPLMGPQELTAVDLYKRGMRDFENKNYIRAIQWFQQSLIEDPSLVKAKNALSDAEMKVKKEIDDLVLDSEKNYRALRLSLSRSQANRALNLLSDQIPGFSFQVQQKQRSLASQKLPIMSRESIYLELPCAQTPDEKTCQRAVEVLRRSRVKLGEENTLK